MNETPVSDARKWGTFAVCVLMALVPALDMTALNQAVPHLTADLRPSATQILWIADAYGFALAGLLITMGGIGDRVGHRRMLLTGAVLFAAASALTAYAGTAELLIAARALLGVAGATLMPSALSLIRHVFTDARERTAAIGMFSGMIGLAVGLGPVVGGALLDHFWWGSVFLVNVPIMLVVLAAGLAVLPESRDPAPGRLDLPSVPLSAVGIVGLVYAVKEAAAHGPWRAEVGIAALAGAVGLALFAVRQRRVAHPLIDVRLFGRIAFTGSVLTNMFAMFALVAQSLIFSLYFQLVLGWSPLKSGLAGLPAAVGAMVGGALLAPPLIRLVGRARAVGAGLALSAVGYCGYLAFGVDVDYLLLVVVMVAGGVGMGVAMTVTSDTVLASVPKDRSGAASAISETATELGGALGLAVLGSVLNAVYRDSVVVPAGAPEAAARDSLGSALEAAAALPPQVGGALVSAARHAYVDGMHAALACSAAFAALVAVAALVTLRSVPAVIPDETEGSDGPPVPAHR
ncbi:MFS transporter [Spirillospora sp. CA-253888]